MRLSGRIFPLTDTPTGQDGSYALLVDEANTLRSIVVRSAAGFADTPPEDIGVTAVTGHLLRHWHQRRGGAADRGHRGWNATQDRHRPRPRARPVVTEERAVWWPLSILPALLAIALVIGVRSGYPIFRPSKVVDVLAAPLGPGERLPAAFGGQVGPNEHDLADPGAALLLVRRGPRGNLLTAQPLSEDGGVAPAPVTIGGSWTSGRVGDVFTVRESVPALVVRSELVNATFLFARTAERDRVAALVSVER